MTLATLFSLTPPSVRLPEPRRRRWQPLRSGLLNLYKYDREEFWYEDGHLLLRGNNGTGKSRVLALQLPFLFDGEVLPSRVEPDGDSAKRMEWNLLMGKYEDRVGYTWLELGRQGEDGRAEYLTLGCGLSATQGQSGVTKWFFTTSLRVGETLFLQAAGGAPLSRDRLREALGSSGELLTTAQAYREAVDAQLFRLGRVRYEALVNLLIQLRKPQLSRALDQAQLAGALREALAPLPQKVVDEIADAFRALEQERAELESFRSAGGAVDRFLETYRRYVQVAVRRAAAVVRERHSRYDDAQGKSRNAQQRHQGAMEALARTQKGLAAKELEYTQATAEHEALEDSEASRDAKTLADRLRRAEAAEARALATSAELERSQRACEGRYRELQEAARELDRAAGTVVRETEGTRAAARAAAFEADWPDLVRSLMAEPTAPERGAFERFLSERNRDMAAIRKLWRAVKAAQAELQGEMRDRDRCSGELEEAIAAEGVERGRFERARATLLERLSHWHRSLTVLKPGLLDEIQASLEDWCEARDTPFPLEVSVKELAEVERSDLARELATLRHRSSERARVRSELDERRRLLEAGQHAPPPTPHTRDTAARHERAVGAPLWRLCDFHPSMPAEARAGLEAALESSGLLDAWVGPDGLELPEGVHDVLLRGTGALSDGALRLSQWLVPAIDPQDPASQALGEGAVWQVLASIGGAAGASAAWVEPSGAFQLGPLSGRWMKPAAQHIGHAAREGARRAELARLEQELAALNDELGALERQIADVQREQKSLEQELSTAPLPGEVLTAGLRLEHATGQVRTRRLRLAELEAKVATARAGVEQASQSLRQTAADLRLADWIARLEELEQNTRELQDRGNRLRLAADQQRFAVVRRDCRQRDLSEAEASLTGARQRSEQARAEAGEARAEYDARLKSVGASVEELHRRLSEAKARASAAAAEVKRLGQRSGELQGECSASEVEVVRAEEALESAKAERAEAMRGLADLGRLDFLELAMSTLANERPSEWSPTRALEVARQLEGELSKVDHSNDAWDRLGNQMQARYGTLASELGGSGLFHPEAALSNGLFQVRVRFQNQLLHMDAVRRVLSDEVMQRQMLLDQRERELLENHLLGEVASHLHELIHAAERWKTEMNVQLGKCPTSTGVALRFDWQPRSDGPAGFAEVRKLLLKNQATWSPEQRKTVGSFLKEQIDHAREVAPDATWQEHLGAAFDYRGWHEFSVQRHQDGRWQRLTKQTHGTGSGGEKAIALTLPQFAAAAAHYQSAAPTAPRLILLDEAFVGVDSDMRSKCMGFLATFDLDFVMTSEREWGCYSTLPGVAICQLTAHAGIDAVHATRFVWNGRARELAPVTLSPAQPPGPEA